LMMLEDIAVIWEVVDVRQSLAFHEKIANADLVCACYPWN
jgi:hypothetical protein